MLTEKIDWDACWVCKRTQEDIERLFDKLDDVDYFEVLNWEHFNGISICPVCNDIFSYLFWIRLNVYFTSMSDLIRDKSPSEFRELWKKGKKS